MSAEEKGRQSIGAAKKKAKGKKKRVLDVGWTVSVFFLSLLISVLLALFSSSLESLSLFFGFLILLLVIALGVSFDFIGLAVASADMANFNSMASRGNPMGRRGVWLVKNAGKVSSFCNDVIGDIAGILSGAIGATLSMKLFTMDTPWGFWGNLLLTGAISAVTVGGKALFKGLALSRSQQVVFFLSRLFCLFSPRGGKKHR